jgi:hypothetical protein
VLCFASIAACTPAFAQNGGSGTILTWISGSSVKLEQILGDCDWQYLDYSTGKGSCKPTTSQTVTRYHLLADGQASSFEDNGKIIFMCGDARSDSPNTQFHAHDPIAYSTSTDPEAGLLLSFLTKGDGTPLFVEPPGVEMGGDDLPDAGISLPDGVYILVHTGHDPNLPDPKQNVYSVLAKFDETTMTFTTGRTVSKSAAGGHFVTGALHASGTDVFMYGVSRYRASDIFLSRTPASGFWAGTGIQYFAGFVNGQPTWSKSEAGAAPVVQDNPLNGPAWPNDSPTVGNLSVVYSSDLGLWLMTYDGGRQTEGTTGIYFTSAPAPWGPWAPPQLIFNAQRDHGYGVFIHDPRILPDPPGDGLNGPLVGQGDATSTRGDAFAPLMIERFTTVAGNTLKIYYTMGTYNPYTVVKMRSEFTITR